MTRGILIAGNDSSLFSALCVEAAKRVETYAAALVPQRRDAPNSAAVNQDSADADADGGGQNAGAPRRIALDWNPASPISARTLVLSALNKLEHISDAVLVCVPPAYRKNAADLSPAEVDVLVDNNIKGWFFLVRELTAIFRARRPETHSPGTLALVMPELGGGFRDDVPDLLGPAASAAFRAFAQGLIASSLAAPYHVLGFSSSEGGEEKAFAAHIFKTMEEEKRGSGKWHKFGKFGLFR